MYKYNRNEWHNALMSLERLQPDKGERPKHKQPLPERCLLYQLFICLLGSGFTKRTAEFSTPPQFHINRTGR